MHQSLKVPKSKYLLYLLIVRILVTDPFRVFCCDLKPKPISQIRVEQSAWMKAVTAFDHFPRLSILKVSFLEHLLSREVIIDVIKVIKGVSFRDDVLVLL